MNNNQTLQNSNITFERLALALAGDYESIYVVDNEDDSYVEYSPAGEDHALTVISKGDDFYADTVKNCRILVFRDDQDMFLNTFRKDNVMQAFVSRKSFSINYRLVIDGVPRFYFLKTIRGMGDDDKYIIIGVRNIDEQVRSASKFDLEKETYHHIANALASRYEVIYYVNAVTNEYTQYSASREYARLGTTKHGRDFFEDAAADIKKYIHKDDVDRLLDEMSKEKLIKNLSTTGFMSLVYRQLLGDVTKYVNMIVISPRNDPDIIIMGVIDIDEQMRKEQSITQKSETFIEIIKALAQHYEVIYHVNTDTDEYTEYSSSLKYAKLKVGDHGTDFFGDTQRNIKNDIYYEDQPMMMTAMRKDVFLASLRETGANTLNYRLMLDGRPQYVSLFAVRPKEDSSHIIIAVTNIDAAMRRELGYKAALGSAMDMASKDALTGIKNKYAYVQAEEKIDHEITDGSIKDFAVAVADVDGLKIVNDTNGHNAGDEYIKDACHMICVVFKHSPVFRVGGDEFAVILSGEDYDNRDELMSQLKRSVEENASRGEVTVSVGISAFERENDMRLQDVFERADKEMYRQKKSCR